MENPCESSAQSRNETESELKLLRSGAHDRFVKLQHRTLNNRERGLWRMWTFLTVRLEEKGGVCDVQWNDGTITRDVKFVVSQEEAREQTVYQDILNGEWYKALNRGRGQVFEPMLVTEHHGNKILVPMRDVLVANVRQ